MAFCNLSDCKTEHKYFCFFYFSENPDKNKCIYMQYCKEKTPCFEYQSKSSAHFFALKTNVGLDLSKVMIQKIRQTQMSRRILFKHGL